MPEMLEIETYRRAAEPVVGRTVAAVDAPDDWYLKRTAVPEVIGALTGARIVGTRRIGKLLLLDTDGPVLGLRFGMTGRLLVDGGASIDRLEYSSDRNDPAWDRFRLGFAGGGDLVMRDPRRLGGVELDPDETALGIDAGAITLAPFRAFLRSTRAPLKAALMNQARLAGLGNLLVDETLWRAGLSPARPADSLLPTEEAQLHRTMRRTLEVLGARGGSHTGDLQPARVRGGRCPRDGEELQRDTIGGRTTYWCLHHQR
ncbi:MAG: DNA-formamidopyrimidine glycosylase family protein [Acidimicrobiales bacterium]